MGTLAPYSRQIHHTSRLNEVSKHNIIIITASPTAITTVALAYRTKIRSQQGFSI